MNLFKLEDVLVEVGLQPLIGMLMQNLTASVRTTEEQRLDKRNYGPVRTGGCAG